MPRWRKDEREAVEQLLDRFSVEEITEEAKRQIAARTASTKSRRGGKRRPQTLRANAFAVWIVVEVRKRLHPGRIGVERIAEDLRKAWHDLPGNPPFPDVATYREEVQKIAKAEPRIAAELERFVVRIMASCLKIPGEVLPGLWVRQPNGKYRADFQHEHRHACFEGYVDSEPIGILIRRD